MFIFIWWLFSAGLGLTVPVEVCFLLSWKQENNPTPSLTTKTTLQGLIVIDRVIICSYYRTYTDSEHLITALTYTVTKYDYHFLTMIVHREENIVITYDSFLGVWWCTPYMVSAPHSPKNRESYTTKGRMVGLSLPLSIYFLIYGLHSQKTYGLPAKNMYYKSRSRIPWKHLRIDLPCTSCMCC